MATFSSINPHKAAREGDLALVRMFIERGQLGKDGLNVRDRDQFTPLHYAANAGFFDVVSLLLSNGADVGARSRFQSTALHFAAEHGWLDIARLLVKAGAPLDDRNSDDAVPLHFACQKGHIDTANLLIDMGADITARTRRGNSPLHYAAFFGRTSIVNSLLKRGADSSLKNHDGKMPGDEFLRTVKDEQRMEIKKLLAAGGSSSPTRLSSEDVSTLHATVRELRQQLADKNDEIKTLQATISELRGKPGEQQAS